MNDRILEIFLALKECERWSRFIQEDLIFIVSGILVRRHRDSVHTWRKGDGEPRLTNYHIPLNQGVYLHRKLNWPHVVVPRQFQVPDSLTQDRERNFQKAGLGSQGDPSG